MSISLTDIPAAVADYLNTQVTTTVSAVTPKDPDQDVLTPGQDGTFTVTATNGDATKGVRLVNVMYHLRVGDDSVLQLIPPPGNGLVLRGFEDLAGTRPITDGQPRGELFIKSLLETVLDAGQIGTALHLSVQSLDQGETSISAHLHADVDQDDLFPTSRNKNGEQTVDVV